MVRAAREVLPRARAARVPGFALRVLTDVFVAVRRAMPAFVVVLRGTTFVVRAETFCVVVRGAVLVVRAATFFALRVSVAVFVVRSRVAVPEILRDGPVEVVVVLVPAEEVGTPRD